MDKTVKEVIIVWIILLVSFNSYIYLKPGITGYFTYSEESGYTDAVNLVVSSDYEWVWELENYGELKSLRLSGRIEDSGSAKVYVENNGEKYLIFDSSGLDEILGGITGLAVLNEPNKTIINEPIEPIINETINETTNISESLENLSINKEIKISLKYHEDSEYDADNNGIETLTGVVDLDVNDSIIGNNIDQTKLCTRWEVNSLDSEEIAAVCYGSEQCCNLVSLVPARKSWNEIFYSYYGQYGAGFDNIISAQIIYADYNLSMDEPYSDIGYSEWDNLSVKFIEENVIEFKDACVESCILEGFNSTSYKLIFEINGTILYLDSIRYTVIKERSTNTPPRPLNNFSDITLIKNNNYTIDLSRYFSDEDGDVLSYDAYETENLSVVIEDSIAAIIPDNGFTGDRYMFFKANDSLLTTVSNVFKVNVTGFKEREETINKTRVVINKPVKWVKKVKLDSIKNNVVINITPFAENITVKKIEDGIKEEIKENKIKIKENGEIKELKDYEKEKINNNLITGNVIGITGFAVEEAVDNSTEIIIEDSVEEVEIEYYTAGPVSEEKKINERKKQIVISSDIHYDNILAYSFLEAEADVDAVKLYWLVNGSRQEVNIDKYDTNENSLVDYIEWNVPSLSSQTYELVIEITKAEHLDSNRGFIDDIYDYVQEQDDNWALVNDGEYVRVTFEVPLDNTRDITLYARSNSSSSVEVYTENSDELITTFEDVSSEKLYQVYLTSLTGSYDTFDLKVNGAVEFDYIVDPKIGTSGNISFVDPTPADGSSQSETYVGVNVSINITSTADLEELVYNWNGTNYTYYNDSLVLMMNFDNVSALGEQTSGINNKTVDVSKYENNGTLYGGAGPTWNATGKYGGSFDFDGIDDYVSVPVADNSNLDISGDEITQTAWIYPVADVAFGTIATRNRGYYFQRHSDGKLGAYQYGTSPEGYHYSTGTAPLNQWSFVAYTYNGTYLTFYINGDISGGVAKTGNITQTEAGLDDPFRVGWDGASGARYFNGTIDEVRIWNISLSSDEIYQQYVSNLNKYDTDKWILYVNQSKNATDGLDDGAYTYQAYASDTAGNWNNTERRTITIDTTPPAINFTSPTPTDGASHPYNSVYINVTSSDANNHSVFLDWNKTLIGWWSFENVLTNGTVYDNSSYGNSAIMYNFTSNTTVDGKRGKAVELTRSLNTEIQLSNLNVDTAAGAQNTVEFWMYWEGSDSEMPFGWNTNYDLWARSGATECFGFNTGESNVLGITSSNLSNKWVHVAAVFYNGVPDSTNNELYIDGVKQSISDCAGTTSASKTVTTSAFISGWGSNAGYKFTGKIDEMRIYNRKLSGEEVNASYSANMENYRNNFTSLGERIYTYKSYAIDLEGNVNQTEERTITIDTTYPAINLTSPTPSNGTAQTETYVGVNVSITESSLGSVVYSWNGTNYTYYNDSLVLMFNFDNVSALGESYNISNGTVILDLSKYGNNGTMYGNTSGVGLVYNTTGKYGGAFEFDGVDDYVNVGDDSSLDFTNVLSISAWVKVYSDNSWCIASRWEDEGSSKRSWILFANPDTTTGFRFVTSSDGTWQPSNSIQAGSLSVGEWTQFTAVYNSTHNILYVNGEYAGSVDRSNDGIYDSNRPTYIGYSPDWANKPRFFNGTIDEVRIWNRILSTDEVYQQYASNLNKYDTDKWNFFSNQTNLTDAAYTYQAFAKDTAGNTNQTEERTVTIDATAPAVTIIYPANNSNWNINKLDFNASIDETASWCGISISGNTNQTMTLNSSSTGANYTNSSIVDGSYTFVVSCNDTANNFAQSGTYNFLVDTVFPNITFVNPTLADGSSTGNNWLFVNTSTKDSNNISTFIDFDDSLVSWWRFDDINGSGDPTDYMSRNNGSKVNQAAQTDLGYFGKAFEFDGDGDYVRVTRAIQDDFTVTAWLKSNMACLTAGSRAYHGNGIVWSDSGGDKNDMVPMACFQGKLAFGTGNTLGTYGTLLSTSDINTSKWVFAAITRLKSTGAKALYINGNLENSETSVTNSLNANSVIDIGGNTLDSRYWNGTIDDVMIFNRSLSANEIRNLYSNQTSKYVTNNFTSLSDGSHSFKAYTQDLAGNVNQTEERTVTVDETNPLIDFVNPTSANNSFTRNNYTEINVSITELNLDEFTWNWNKTNYTMYNDSLILMYNFDNISSLGEIYNNSNGSIIKDVSNAGNDGILYVGADNSGNYTTGKYGGAFEFDGVDDYVNISDANSLDFGTSSFTLTVWAKAESLNTYRMIISKGNDERYRIGYWNNNTVYFEVDDDITAKNVYSTRTITDNQWHQLVAVRDDPNNRMQIFIDGNLSGTTNDDAGDVSNDISLIIGQDARLANQFFNGTIDEVRVWNRTLSAEEIKQQYLSNLNKYDIDRWNFFSNQTNLTDNTYTYQAYATDKAGNTNQTEERAVTIDTTNPIVTLISPANNSGDSDGNITLHYNVADTNNVTNCSLIINGKINITNSSITKEATQNFKLTNIAVGPYNWSINCSDSANNIGNSEKRFLSIALSNEFITTNLSNVNITNITNLIIEKEKVGKINFSDSIDLSDGADINYYINLSNNRIEINSTALPQLNKSATLYLFNLTFANPRILRDGEICPETICKEVSYTKAGGYGNLTFNVTRFTVYSADETPVAAEETAADSGTGGGGGGGGAGGGAGLPFPDICYSDSDCEEGYSCLNHKCVELFDMKVIGVDSPIQPGEFLDFTYLMKGMANISGDVIVNFWLEKDGKVATSGSDTIYLGPFEEKIETTSISLPLNIATGIYDFYVQINYGNYAAKAFRTVQVDYIVPDILEISLKDLPQINSEDIFEFYAILSYNKHTPIQLFLEERLKRGNKTVWEKERDLLLNRSITLTEKIGELKAGEYQLELIGSYNNKTSRLSQTFNVESTFKGNLFNHIILAAVISVFTIFFIFYKKLKGARELEAYRFQQYLTYISRKIGEKSTRKCISVLVNYLRKNRARGIEDIKLKRALIQAGWPEMLIEGVFKNPDLMRQKHATRPPDSIS